jgi:hypothetical protein
MNVEMNHPLVIFAASVVVLWFSAWIGFSIFRRKRSQEEGLIEDYGVTLTATLTLLALIIGFTFSMAIGRYDLRKSYEEAEANAIGTELVRADLLPSADAAKVRGLMRRYLDERILFYTADDEQQLRQIAARTAQLQSELWSTVAMATIAQPTSLPVAMAASAMNDALNSQGYTQAAWWNRIPHAAWWLMAALAVCCNLLVGYGARTPKAHPVLLSVLPIAVSIAFMLIADIDSPRGGFIHVAPQNLASLSESLGRK